MSGLRITYSLADQSFAKTKSIGIFNLSLGLARELQTRREIERLDVLTNSTLIDQIPTAASTGIYNSDTALKGQIGRIKWDQWDVYSAAHRRRNPWLFLPKGFASFLRRPPVKLATYVHDTIHDFYRSNHSTAVARIENRYFDYSLRSTMQLSDAIFTNSDFTRREILRIAEQNGVEPPNPIHAGIGFEDNGLPPAREKAGLVVLAGRFPHKLTGQMIDWLNRWQRNTAFSENVEWIGSLPADSTFPDHSNWRLNPRLSESEYRDKIREARALLFASEYEGFGMPPIEAAIAGTAPVYSKIPATSEVMGTAGFSFDNKDYESFNAALSPALQTTAAEIADWKRELLARHNWKSVGDRILSGLKKNGG